MNYYRAVEKKAEHGGGWAYMQLNRRAGAAIVCGWSDSTTFYLHQLNEGDTP